MPTIEELANQLNSSDQPTVYRAKKQLAAMAAAAGAPGKAGDRTQLASALVKAETAKNEKGEAKYSAKARGELARTLSEVGGDREVPGLAETLKDFDAREMARFSLDRMTCQAATDALCDAALNAVGVEFRIGAINALGRRSGSQIVDVLKACAGDNDPELRLAAAEALANHSDASADPLIAELVKQDGQRAALRATKARVRLAARLAGAGQKEAAKKIYQSIAQSDTAAAAQKKAAAIGLTQLG